MTATTTTSTQNSGLTGQWTYINNEGRTKIYRASMSGDRWRVEQDSFFWYFANTDEIGEWMRELDDDGYRLLQVRGLGMTVNADMETLTETCVEERHFTAADGGLVSIKRMRSKGIISTHRVVVLIPGNLNNSEKTFFVRERDAINAMKSEHDSFAELGYQPREMGPIGPYNIAGSRPAQSFL